jgi:hypothetical protein
MHGSKVTYIPIYLLWFSWESAGPITPFPSPHRVQFDGEEIVVGENFAREEGEEEEADYAALKRLYKYDVLCAAQGRYCI